MLTVDTLIGRGMTRGEARTYLEMRAAGRTTWHAVYVLHTMRTADAVLSYRSDADGAPYGTRDVLEAYDVDAAQLAIVTADVRWSTVVDATTGERIVHPVILPPGASARLYVYSDDDHDSPADELESEGGCYSLEDVAAWRADLWRFVGVAVVVTLANGDTGEAALWGIEQGDYWPGSDESDVWHAVVDVTAEALADALATTSNVSSAVSESLL